MCEGILCRIEEPEFLVGGIDVCKEHIVKTVASATALAVVPLGHSIGCAADVAAFVTAVVAGAAILGSCTVPYSADVAVITA